MGQRTQIVLIAPEVCYGENNPNSNKGKIFISHNQWRYGFNAIYVLRHMIEKYLYMKDLPFYKESRNYFFSTLNKTFDSCVRYAENRNIKSMMTESHPFEDYTDQFIEYFTKKKDIYGFLNKYTDNNNGWFIVRVFSDLSIKVSFINGYEESDEIKQRTAKEYCDFFRDMHTDEEDIENLKFLKSYENDFNIEENFKQLYKKIKITSRGGKK